MPEGRGFIQQTLTVPPDRLVLREDNQFIQGLGRTRQRNGLDPLNADAA
jgi:hypothetical protein